MSAAHPFVASITGRQNASALDEWSIVHTAVGLGAGLMGINAWIFLAGIGAYEVFEFLHESPRGSPIFGSKRPEWDANMVADIGVAALGYAWGKWARDNADAAAAQP